MPEFIELVESNCKDITDYTYGELLSLAGYSHIPKYQAEDQDTLFHCRLEYHCKNPLKDKKGIVFVEFSNFFINALSVKIDLKTKSIYNGLIKSRKTAKANKYGGGVGLAMLVDQILSARKLGFRCITLTAWGGNLNWHRPHMRVDRRATKGCIGYILWGKAGYTMDADFKIKFKDFIRHWDATSKNLFRMLHNPNELGIWKKRGGYWHGVFYVKENSRNIKLLREYINRKGKEGEYVV